jgi:ubiquinone/menaquinone biosynthesis C-methylase UbiE
MYKKDNVEFDLKLVKQFWNNAASKHKSTTAFDDQIFKKFVTDKSSRILDIGCGYGRILNTLYKHGFVNSLGIDISEKMLERGEKEFPHLHFAHTDGMPFDLRSNSFDVVLLFGLLCSMVKNQDQLYLMSELHRFLKPNGIIYISDFLIMDSSENIERYNKFNTTDDLPYGVFQINKDTPLFRHYDPAWIKELTSSFKPLYYREQEFKTMDNKHNTGFICLGQNSLKISD